MKLELRRLAAVSHQLYVFKTALAAALAWLAATKLSQNPFPYFAPLAAVLTLQVTVADSLQKGLQRTTGIILGVMLSVIIGHFHIFGSGVAAIFLLILLATAIPTLMHLSPQITSQVAVSSLLVFSFGDKQGYAVGRIMETIIGSGIAVAVNALVFPPNRMPAAEKSLLTLGRYAQAALRGLSQLVGSQRAEPAAEGGSVQQLIDETERAGQMLILTRQSLKFNPFLFKSRARLAHLTDIMNELERITIQIRGIRRGLLDLQELSAYEQELDHLQVAAEAIEVTAPVIEAFVVFMLHPSSAAGVELKTHLSQASSKQLHGLKEMREIQSLAVLRDVGGILTDLSRIIRETELAAKRSVTTSSEFV